MSISNIRSPGTVVKKIKEKTALRYRIWISKKISDPVITPKISNPKKILFLVSFICYLAINLFIFQDYFVPVVFLNLLKAIFYYTFPKAAVT